MKQTKRNKEAHIRFTEEELARVKVLSAATGKSVGEYLRTAALNENAVHIIDGKEVAKKLGHLHNKMILYHGDMAVRLEELKGAVRAYTTMASQFGNGLPCSSSVQETAANLNLRVEAAVNMLFRAYGEMERQTEEKLQQAVQGLQLSGGV